jgi:hypothetical protein
LRKLDFLVPFLEAVLTKRDFTTATEKTSFMWLASSISRKVLYFAIDFSEIGATHAPPSVVR